jgi:hypothetical protein
MSYKLPEWKGPRLCETAPVKGLFDSFLEFDFTQDFGPDAPALAIAHPTLIELEEKRIAEARAICYGCVNEVICRQHALAHPEETCGMWGGTTDEERAEILWHAEIDESKSRHPGFVRLGATIIRVDFLKRSKG